MGQLFQEGTTKIRPGVYYRYSKLNEEKSGTTDGINGIVMNANWGPVKEVIKVTSVKNLKSLFGDNDSVEAAKAIFEGGANTLYVYRPLGKNGAATKGSVEVKGSSTGKLTIAAQYAGSLALKVKVELSLDKTKKTLIVCTGTVERESYTIDAGGDEVASMCEKIKALGSNYVEVDEATNASGDLALGTFDLQGTDATLSTEDYLEGFEKLESCQYGYLSTDSDDATVAESLAQYVEEANKERGKSIVGVIGCMGDSYSTFGERINAAKGYNSPYIICQGNGYYAGEEKKVEGAKAVCYTAGLVSATPSNKSIVHSIIAEATDIVDNYTNKEYEQAIENGLLLLSVSTDGQIWYDSGINTLKELSGLQDEGWKKIKRVKVRNELLNRLDRVMSTKVGRVSCDKDGIADVLQGGIGVIDEMINEGKLFNTSTMYLDPEVEPGVDSVNFIIDADDIDSLEKIYLHYQFRYSSNA